MENKPIALVTEAGNGLSLKFAAILDKEGFEVIIAAKGNSYIKLIERQLKGIKVLEANFTEIGEAVKIYAYIKTHYGKLDVLVNNAEIANGFGQKLTELDLREVKLLFDENVFSAINLSKALMPMLGKSDKARVINITSGLGDSKKITDGDYPYSDYKMTAYSMSKAALNMFTVLLDKEFEPTSINVSGFDPIRVENCTHNEVTFCKEVEQEFIYLLE